MDTPIEAPGGTPQGNSTQVVTDYIREKDQERNVTPRQDRPLTLLELPVDILQLIVKEVSLFLSSLHASAVLTWCPPDHSYKRSDSTCLDELGSARACYTSDILTVRHCLARWTHHGNRIQERGRLDLRTQDAVSRKRFCSHHARRISTKYASTC